MSMDFGKLNFAVGFNRTSAFPLDANSYFESYSAAQAAAASAAEVGSSDSAYYIGQLIIVKDENNFGLYQISATKTLVKFGQASSEADLQSQLSALAARVDGLDTSKAGWGETSIGHSEELVVIDDTGQIRPSGHRVSDNVSDNNTFIPTSKAVRTYVASQVASAVQYLGTVSALTGLSTTAGKGDFYRLSAAIEGAHAGDLVIAEKDNPAQLIDGINWTLVHGEEVGVESITAGTGIKIDTSGTNSEAQPKISIKPATKTAIGGIIVGTNLSITSDGRLSATDTTYEDATQTVPGLMSAADKKKLDDIAEKATAVTVDDKFIANSANPVQSKVIQTEFANVRSELSSVENNLTAEIAKKVNIEDIATIVEQGNNDPVSSDAVANAFALNQYTLPVASAGALGGIKVGYDGTTEKTYAVKLDTNNKAYVEVPWKNTTYTNGNGLTLTGTSFSLNVASSAMHGGIKLYNDKLNKEITPQAATDTDDRYYRIQLDNANRAFVNVPWKNTVYTHPAGSAASKTSGLYKFSTDTTSHISGVTAVTKEDITALGIPGSDTNTAHNHSAGVGLTGSGTAGISGTYTYKVNLVNETPASNAASYTSAAASKFYAVQLDKNSKLGVYVPWTDENFRPIKVNNDNVDAAASIKFVNGTNISLALEHETDVDNITINHAGPGSASQTTTGTKENPELVEDGGTVNFGADFYVPSFGIDANGHTRELKMTKYSLPTPETYSLKPATTTVLGGIKLGTLNKSFKEGFPRAYVTGADGSIELGNLPSEGDKADLEWLTDNQTVYLGIKKVSTDKLVQGANTLIINGGGAAW